MSKKPIMTEKPSKKDLLLEAGLDIFYSRGFDRATIDEIVDRAGCGKGTFYRYFQNKELLFDALEKRFRDMLMLELEEQCPYSLPVDQFLRAALHSLFKIFRINHRLGLVKMARDQQTGRAASDYDRMPPGLAYIFNYLKSAADRGHIRKLRCEALLACLLGAVHFFLFRDSKLCIPVSDQELEDTIDILLHGVLPS